MNVSGVSFSSNNQATRHSKNQPIGQIRRRIGARENFLDRVTTEKRMKINFLKDVG
jgi:hypothetical protein